MPPSPVHPPGTDLTSHRMGLAGYSHSTTDQVKLEFDMHPQMGSSLGFSAGMVQREGSSCGFYSASDSTFKPAKLFTPEPHVPGLSEAKSPLIPQGATRRLSIDEHGSYFSQQGLTRSAPLMPKQATATSFTPDENPPGISREIQTAYPPVCFKQAAISSAVCLPMPTMPSVIDPHTRTTSISGPLGLSSKGHEISSTVSAEGKPPGVEEIPAAVSSAKLSTHLHSMPPLSQQYTGNSMPTVPLIPPGGMPSRFSRPPHGFYSQIPPPPPFPPPMPPAPPLLQRHVRLSGPPSQTPRFGLYEGNVDIDMTRKPLILDKEKLTIFVGKIVPSLDDKFLTSILELCGSVRSWMRAQDPVTGRPKGFGFCKYESPEGLLRALRLLNRLKLEGHELVLKVDQTTLNYLEHYVDEKIKRLKQQMGAEVEIAPGLEATNVVKQLTLDVPREVPVEERLGWAYDKENEIDKEVCGKLLNLLEDRDRMESLDLPSTVATTELNTVETDEEYELGSPTEESWQSVKLTEWKQFECALERCKLKVQGVHGAHRSSELYYLEYEKLWEERERAKENQRNMERERAEAMRKTRQKLLKRQEESSGSHKKLCYDEEKKTRVLERVKDDKDRKLEQQKNGCTTASSSGNKEDNHLPTCDFSQSRFLDLSTRAKIAFCFKGSSKQRPSQQVFVPSAGDDRFWGVDEHPHKQRRPLASSVHYRNPTFTWERESTPDDCPSIPERERSADANEPTGIHFEKQSVTLEKKKSIDAKELIDSLPRTKNEIFAFSMDWAKFDEHCLHERIRPWVSKKILEFLGEEEATLVDFIITSAKKHMNPTHLLELLENIFVEEAELFVVKLWRMVIYELRKVECGFSGG